MENGRRKCLFISQIENGCKVTIPLSDKHAHVAVCPFAIVPCPYSDDLVMKHVLYINFEGNFCGFVCKRSELQSHLNDCKYVPIKCKNDGCGKMIW